MTSYAPEDFDGMARREMQKVCKQIGIRANTKNDVMRAALRSHFQVAAQSGGLADITNTNQAEECTPQKKAPSTPVAPAADAIETEQIEATIETPEAAEEEAAAEPATVDDVAMDEQCDLPEVDYEESDDDMQMVEAEAEADAPCDGEVEPEEPAADEPAAAAQEDCAEIAESPAKAEEVEQEEPVEASEEPEVEPAAASATADESTHEPEPTAEAAVPAVPAVSEEEHAKALRDYEAALNATNAENNIESLVESLAELSFTEYGKVRCNFTGHDLPPKISSVMEHISSSKYQRVKASLDEHALQIGATVSTTDHVPAESELNLDRYAPWIVCTDCPTEVRCTVTGAVLKRTKSSIERHMAGETFKKLKKKMRGLPTPKGKKKIFNTPEKALSKDYNVHWTLDDYQNDA